MKNESDSQIENRYEQYQKNRNILEMIKIGVIATGFYLIYKVLSGGND